MPAVSFAQSSEDRLRELLRVRRVLVRMQSLNRRAQELYNVLVSSGVAIDSQASEQVQGILDACGPPGWRNSYFVHDLDFTTDGGITVFTTDWTLSGIVMNALLGLESGKDSGRPLVGWETE